MGQQSSHAATKDPKQRLIRTAITQFYEDVRSANTYVAKIKAMRGLKFVIVKRKSLGVPSVSGNDLIWRLNRQVSVASGDRIIKTLELIDFYTLLYILERETSKLQAIEIREALHRQSREGSSSLADNLCPICFERNSDTLLSSCAHRFCSTCIQDWLKKDATNKSCPMCRGEGNSDADAWVLPEGDDYLFGDDDDDDNDAGDGSGDNDAILESILKHWEDES